MTSVHEISGESWEDQYVKQPAPVPETCCKSPVLCTYIYMVHVVSLFLSKLILNKCKWLNVSEFLVMTSHIWLKDYLA